MEDSVLDLLFEEYEPILPEFDTDWKNNSWDIVQDDPLKDIFQDDVNFLINEFTENHHYQNCLVSDLESSSLTSASSHMSSSVSPDAILEKTDSLGTVFPLEETASEVVMPSNDECYKVDVDVNTEQNISESAQPGSIIIYPIFYEEVVTTCNEISNSTEDNCREVKLTPEEKKLLEREGFPLPTHYPLTKEEEKNLKKVQRKIRNKVSAQDSRRRKKEYVDGLESRVKYCSTQNEQLQKKVKQLESQNRSLASELKKLKSLLNNYGSKNVEASTCLFVLIISFALIVTPNIWHNKADKDTVLPSASGPARSLLSIIYNEASTLQKLITSSHTSQQIEVERMHNSAKETRQNFDFQLSLLSDEMVTDNNSSASETIVNAPQLF